jgi:hypothetical protein
MKTQLPKPIRNATRIWALAFLVLLVPATRSHAQFFGYGNYGYGYPGFGYGYGYPPVGYNGYGYGGGLGFGLGLGYGYNPTSYGYFGNAYPPGLLAPIISGVGDTNPLMGVGLTPLGVQSALAEGTLLRGSRASIAGRPAGVNPYYGPGAVNPYYGSAAANPYYGPAAVNPYYGPGAVNPVPGAGPSNPLPKTGAAGQYSGTGSARPR